MEDKLFHLNKRPYGEKIMFLKVRMLTVQHAVEAAGVLLIPMKLMSTFEEETTLCDEVARKANQKLYESIFI